MKYNIKNISDYINELIGYDTNIFPIEKGVVGGLPFILIRQGGLGTNE